MSGASTGPWVNPTTSAPPRTSALTPQLLITQLLITQLLITQLLITQLFIAQLLSDGEPDCYIQRHAEMAS